VRCNEAVTELRASLVGAANYGDGSGFIHMCITACAASEPAFSAVAIVEFEHDRLAAAQREEQVELPMVVHRLEAQRGVVDHLPGRIAGLR
jgi:hypothetical protein